MPDKTLHDYLREQPADLNPSLRMAAAKEAMEADNAPKKGKKK